MEAETEVVYTKRKGLKLGRTFLPRCGIALIVLIFYVLFAFYTELQQANELLMEIKRQNVVNSRKISSSKEWSPEHSKKPDEDTSIQFYENIFDEGEDLTNLRNDSDIEDTRDEMQPRAITKRFKENVYMIRKRFYELHQNHMAKSNAVDKAPEQNPRDPKSNTVDKGPGQYPRDPLETRQKINQQELSRNSRGSRKNIIIVAYHRSGSSFLGEMFNRNPDVFYLFEPIHTIDKFLDARRRFPILYDTLIRQLLDTIFSCDFERYPLLVSTLASNGFRLKSQTISSRLCDPRATPYKMHLCRRINATHLNTLCNSRLSTVIKTIRMANWDNLDFLTKRDSPRAHSQLQVIHLVRDPRGIIASRMLVSYPSPRENATIRVSGKQEIPLRKYVGLLSAKLCGQLRNDINDWTKRIKLGQRLAMIRYEDAAKRPFAAYEEISQFAGVDQSEEVTEWLRNNTKCDTDGNYYSTSRNSSKAPHVWRRRLTITLVVEIQNHCTEVMSTLGYKKVYTEKHLKNMRESLVVDWGDKGFLKTKPYVLDAQAK